MSYTTPITDRTAQDVTDRTAKAFINIVDWLRIYGNAQMVNSLVVALGGQPVLFDSLIAPTITTIPAVSELNILLANIERIRIAAYLDLPGIDTELKHDWFEGSAADAPDYLDANQWESVLDIILDAIVKTTYTRIYCGVPNVGQVRFYQARWRVYGGWVQNSGDPVRRARTGVAQTGTNLTRMNRFRRYD